MLLLVDRKIWIKGEFVGKMHLGLFMLHLRYQQNTQVEMHRNDDRGAETREDAAS